MECCVRCQSKQHLYQLNAVVQNGTLDEAKAFIKSCSNPFRGCDTYGRSLLHMASSHGKTELIGWILEKSKSSLNTKDKESGWTALHRSIFYGQISSFILLKKYGASMNVKDNECLTPYDLCTVDHQYVPYMQTHEELRSYDVYTWGDNSNYTLGHGKESCANIPEAVETLRHKQKNIKQVLTSRYHTVFLTLTGEVYTCGHGRGGRLGLGHEEPTLYPTLIKMHKRTPPAVPNVGERPPDQRLPVTYVACGRDHTLLLAANHLAYSCGMNEYGQLGIGPPSRAQILKPIMMIAKELRALTQNFRSRVTHISAGRFHSVVATSQQIMTFGLNAGQLGHAKGSKKCVTPHLVTGISLTQPQSISGVSSCDAATVVAVSGERKEGFFVLHKYNVRFVSFRGQKFDKKIVSLSVSGGELDVQLLPTLLNNKGATPLRVFWINNIHQLLYWSEQDGLLQMVTFPSLGRQLSCYRLCSSLTEILLTTQSGQAYLISQPDGRPPSTSNSTSDVSSTVSTSSGSGGRYGRQNMPVLELKARRIPGVYRATECSIDYKSANYAVLVSKEYTCLFSEVDMSQVNNEYRTLFESADQSDGTTDLILQCEGKTIPCHRYILASRSTYFRKLLTKHGTSKQVSAAHTHNSNNSEQTKMSDESSSDDEEQVVAPNTFSNGASNGADGMVTLKLDCSMQLLTFVLKYIYTDEVDTSLVFQFQQRVSLTIGGQGTADKSNSRKTNSRLSTLQQSVADQQQEILLDIANKFGIKQIISKRKVSAISYTLKKFPQWYDIVLTSSDGREIGAHKCVLMARMEYFRTMLTGHWCEGLGLERRVTLDLPIPADLLTAVLLFIYTDDHQHLSGKNDVEFLVNVMMVADQLLVMRLKQICEKLIIYQLNVDNVTQVFSLAEMCHSTNLLEASMLMICLNMAEMLELSLLDDLDAELLDKLTRYYRENLTCMSRRFLGKVSDGPSEEERSRIVEEYLQQEVTPSSVKRASKRCRTSSSSSVESEIKALAIDQSEKARPSSSSFSLDDEAFNMEFKDFSVISGSEEVHPSSIPFNGTKEIAMVTDIGTLLPPATVVSLEIPSTSQTTSPQTLRHIMSEQKEPTTHKPLQHSKLKSKHVKRSKFRSLDLTEPTTSTNLEQSPSSSRERLTSTSSTSAWSAAPSTAAVTSLKDVMKNEESMLSASGRSAKATRKSASPSQKSSKSLAAKPSTPVWGSASMTSSLAADNSIRGQSLPAVGSQSTGGASASVNLQDIMTEEAKEMEALLLTTNKPLSLIQIEERALQELYNMYEQNKSPSETISVERVAVKAAAPQWVNQSDSRL